MWFGRPRPTDRSLARSPLPTRIRPTDRPIRTSAGGVLAHRVRPTDRPSPTSAGGVWSRRGRPTDRPSPDRRACLVQVGSPVSEPVGIKFDLENYTENAARAYRHVERFRAFVEQCAAPLTCCGAARIAPLLQQVLVRPFHNALALDFLLVGAAIFGGRHASRADPQHAHSKCFEQPPQRHSARRNHHGVWPQIGASTTTVAVAAPALDLAVDDSILPIVVVVSSVVATRCTCALASGAFVGYGQHSDRSPPCRRSSCWCTQGAIYRACYSDAATRSDPRCVSCARVATAGLLCTSNQLCTCLVCQTVSKTALALSLHAVLRGFSS